MEPEYENQERSAISDCKSFREPPIFIVGAPRSGTTLLCKLLGRHPRLAIFRETQFWRYVYSRRHAFGNLARVDNRRRLVAEYLGSLRIRRPGIDVAGLEARLLAQADSYRAFFVSILEEFAESQRKPRYGEKTPNHAFCTEMLCEWFPGAAIIHLVRDPREVVASLQRVPWAPDNVIANAKTWVRYNLAAQRSSHRPEYLVVHYYNLVTRPDHELLRICTHLNEPYTESMLIPTEESIPISWWSQKSVERVSTEQLGKWRKQMKGSEVALVDWVVKPYLESFGYTTAVAPASLFTVGYGVGVGVLETVRRTIASLPTVTRRWLRPKQLTKETEQLYASLGRAGFGSPQIATLAATTAEGSRIDP